MKRETVTLPLEEASLADPPTPVQSWYVYNASGVHVATYSDAASAAAHCLAWPALYYRGPF